MATRDTDLSSLRIERGAHDPRTPRKAKRIKKIILWGGAVAALVLGLVLLRSWFSPAIEVQVVTASLTSPAQVNAV